MRLLVLAALTAGLRAAPITLDGNFGGDDWTPGLVEGPVEPASAGFLFEGPGNSFLSYKDPPADHSEHIEFGPTTGEFSIFGVTATATELNMVVGVDFPEVVGVSAGPALQVQIALDLDGQSGSGFATFHDAPNDGFQDPHFPEYIIVTQIASTGSATGTQPVLLSTYGVGESTVSNAMAVSSTAFEFSIPWSEFGPGVPPDGAPVWFSVGVFGTVFGSDVPVVPQEDTEAPFAIDTLAFLAQPTVGQAGFAPAVIDGVTGELSDPFCNPGCGLNAQFDDECTPSCNIVQCGLDSGMCRGGFEDSDAGFYTPVVAAVVYNDTLEEYQVDPAFGEGSKVIIRVDDRVDWSNLFGVSVAQSNPSNPSEFFEGPVDTNGNGGTEPFDAIESDVFSQVFTDFGTYGYTSFSGTATGLIVVLCPAWNLRDNAACYQLAQTHCVTNANSMIPSCMPYLAQMCPFNAYAFDQCYRPACWSSGSGCDAEMESYCLANPNDVGCFTTSNPPLEDYPLDSTGLTGTIVPPRRLAAKEVFVLRLDENAYPEHLFLKIRFEALNIVRVGGSETWGIDNFSVGVGRGHVPTPGAVGFNGFCQFNALSTDPRRYCEVLFTVQDTSDDMGIIVYGANNFEVDFSLDLQLVTAPTDTLTFPLTETVVNLGLGDSGLYELEIPGLDRSDPSELVIKLQVPEPLGIRMQTYWTFNANDYNLVACNSPIDGRNPRDQTQFLPSQTSIIPVERVCESRLEPCRQIADTASVYIVAHIKPSENQTFVNPASVPITLDIDYFLPESDPPVEITVGQSVSTDFAGEPDPERRFNYYVTLPSRAPFELVTVSLDVDLAEGQSTNARIVGCQRPTLAQFGDRIDTYVQATCSFLSLSGDLPGCTASITDARSIEVGSTFFIEVDVDDRDLIGQVDWMARLGSTDCPTYENLTVCAPYVTWPAIITNLDGANTIEAIETTVEGFAQGVVAGLQNATDACLPSATAYLCFERLARCEDGLSLPVCEADCQSLVTECNTELNDLELECDPSPPYPQCTGVIPFTQSASGTRSQSATQSLSQSQSPESQSESQSQSQSQSKSQSQSPESQSRSESQPQSQSPSQSLVTPTSVVSFDIDTVEGVVVQVTLDHPITPELSDDGRRPVRCSLVGIYTGANLLGNSFVEPFQSELSCFLGFSFLVADVYNVEVVFGEIDAPFAVLPMAPGVSPVNLPQNPPRFFFVDVNRYFTEMVVSSEIPLDVQVGLAPCASFLTSEFVAQLGDGAQCVWRSYFDLAIQVGYNATLPLSGTVDFPAGVLRGRDAAFFPGPADLVPTLFPVNEAITAGYSFSTFLAPDPVAITKYPLEASLCGPLRIDASASYGSAARPLSFSWSFVNVRSLTDTEVDPLTVSRLADALTTADGQPLVEVARSDLAPDAEYTLTVEVRDFVDKTDTATVVFNTTSAPIPLVTIGGAVERVVRRSDPVTFEALLEQPCAASDVDRDTLTTTYEWYVTGSALPPVSGDTPLDFTARSLVLEPFSLETDGTYEVSVTVTVGEYSAQAFASVTVEPQPIVVVLEGGNSAIPSDQPVVLDASKSFDPDAQGTTTDDFTFEWTCAVLDDFVGEFPDDQFPPGGRRGVPPEGEEFPTLPCNPAIVDQLQSAEQVLVVPAGNLTVDRQYIFSVRIASASRGGAEFSIDTNLDIVPAGPPAVFVEPVTGNVALNDKVVLEAEVTLATPDVPLFFCWVEANSAVDLSDPAVALSPRTSSVLVLAPDALLPAIEYVFFVLVAYDEAACNTARLESAIKDEPVVPNEGRAFVSFVPASPPFGGTVTVSPESGVGYDDTFVISANGWLDEADSPLTYEFSYHRESEADSSPVLLRSAAASNSVAVRLPPPPPGVPVTTYTLLVAVASSATGAVATSFIPVTVLANPSFATGTDLATSVFEDDLQDALDDGDLDSAQYHVDVILDALADDIVVEDDAERTELIEDTAATAGFLAAQSDSLADDLDRFAQTTRKLSALVTDLSRQSANTTTDLIGTLSRAARDADRFSTSAAVDLIESVSNLLLYASNDTDIGGELALSLADAVNDITVGALNQLSCSENATALSSSNVDLRAQKESAANLAAGSLTTGSSGSAVFELPAGAFATGSDGDATCFGAQLATYQIDPFEKTANGTLALGLVNVLTLYSEGGVEQEVSGLDEDAPVKFTVEWSDERVGSDFDPETDLLCGAYDTQRNKWTDDGCEVVEVNEEFVLCACYHLTAFSAFSNSVNSADVVNPVDPDINADLRRISFFVAMGIIVTAIGGYVATMRWDQRAEKRLDLVGVAPGDSEMVGLDPNADEESTSSSVRQKTNAAMGRAHWWHGYTVKEKASGFKRTVVRRIKRNHVVLGIFYRALDDPYTRSQRVLTLTAVVFGELAVNAAFYEATETGQSSVGQVIATGMLAALCMLPVSVALPYLFRRFGRPVMVPGKDVGNKLRPNRSWLLMIPYGIAFTCIGLFVWMVLRYGWEFEESKEEEWLLSSTVSFLQDWLVDEPLTAIVSVCFFAAGSTLATAAT